MRVWRLQMPFVRWRCALSAAGQLLAPKAASARVAAVSQKFGLFQADSHRHRRTPNADHIYYYLQTCPNRISDRRYYYIANEIVQIRLRSYRFAV
ncbi:unnamed protein product [Angiostrongylus costaricensis]|uniref:Secreted protein n=1 Tax=Angiostrongylus costaricensis TaxID=334426 RepID=A0A0R3PNT7_ANGCS|nr:unnamed protein product [Angiostrongylus costaricensis]